MGSQQIEQPRPYNTPFECGLRALFILAASEQAEMGLQRLVYYDYATTHLNDLPRQTDESLHPQLPYRSSEWVARRETLRHGLGLMSRKGLLDVEFAETGLFYSANSLTHYFIGHFDSDYTIRLQDHALKVALALDSLAEGTIETLMIEHLGHWGAEFMEQINRRLADD